MNNQISNALSNSKNQVIQSLQKFPINKLNPIIKEVFENRNYNNESIQNLLSNHIKNLKPYPLLDFDKGVNRVFKAIENNENIAIYGDYDVDGTTSCAVFHHFFKIIKFKNFKVYQPSRFIEGYGIHPESIDKIHQDENTVIVTVDCGVTNHQAALRAKDLNIDLIITDHHKETQNGVPDAFAVINPNRNDQKYDTEQNEQFKSLAGVGVAFFFCWKLKELLENSRKIKYSSLYPLLQFVALGTLCDMANLSSLNLRLCRHGIAQLPSTNFVGLKVFLKKEHLQENKVSYDFLTFLMGPMINSKGRLEHPETSFKLLTSESWEDAFKLYNILLDNNTKRKMIQKQVFEESIIQIDENLNKDLNNESNIQIVYCPDWHEGVIGIVASKIVERYSCPAICLTSAKENDLIKGSARSFGDINLFQLLESQSNLFTKFGGHKAAAGLTMPLSNLELLKKNLNEFLGDKTNEQRTILNSKSFNCEIELDQITPDLIEQLELLGPYGPGHEEIIFSIKNFEIKDFKLLKEKHLKLTLVSINKSMKINSMFFFYTDQLKFIEPDKLIGRTDKDLMLIGKLQFNRFKFKKFLQIQIQKIIEI